MKYFASILVNMTTIRFVLFRSEFFPSFFIRITVSQLAVCFFFHGETNADSANILPALALLTESYA